MRFDFLCRVSRLAAIGAILLGSASCININEELGESLIPTDQTWDVYPQDAVDLQDIRLHMTGNLSGYNTSRFTSCSLFCFFFFTVNSPDIASNHGECN